jgi:hypothetical protein
MSADNVIVFFGVRYIVESAEELERLEARDDPRAIRARRGQLRIYWGCTTEGGPYFLLVGTEIGRFGVEGISRAEVSGGEVHRIMEETRRKLDEAGLEGEAKLHIQLEAEQ